MKIFTVKFKRKTNELPVCFGDVEFIESAGAIKSMDAQVELSDKECKLMRFFINNSKTVIPDDSVVMGAWGEGDERELEAYVGFLRQKLEYLKSEIKIFKINGLGYKICTAE